jgi:acylphosphatase
MSRERGSRAGIIPHHMKEQRHLRIHGKVQGVGYRFFATRVARRMGLKGWIENNRDGTVEALVEGEKKTIDEWIEEIREGPRYAEVTHIEQESKDYTGRLPDFDVKF